MKKFAILAVLGAGITCNAAIADTTGLYYQASGTPTKSSYTITLSGECSGKIVQPITGIYYGREYSHTEGLIDSEYGFGDWVTIQTNTGGVGMESGLSPDDKHIETLKNGKLTFKLIATRFNAIPSLDSLSSDVYESLITCKNGLPLSAHVSDGEARIFAAAKSYKSQLSLTHTHDITDPAIATYNIKYSASGILVRPGQCAQKGKLLDSAYGLTCGQPKPIYVKVAVTAEGASVLDL